MQITTNYGLNVYQGDDLFNPLTVENVNAQLIDEQMKSNANAAVTTATELVTGTVHALARSDVDCAVFRFTATSNYEAGHTFTVDGVQVSALLTNGTTLPTGAYIIGSEVLCVLKGTLMTVLSAGNTLALDSEKLNGQNADYYATSESVESVSSLATLNGSKITEINQTLTNKLLLDSDISIGVLPSGANLSNLAGDGYSINGIYFLSGNNSYKDLPTNITSGTLITIRVRGIGGASEKTILQQIIIGTSNIAFRLYVGLEWTTWIVK